MHQKQFNAKCNDIWCVGVCLFKMVLGIEPWYKAQKGDIYFDLVINGKLDQLLKIRKKDHLVNKELLQLFDAIFQYQENRINIKKMKDCLWFKE